MTEEHGVRNLKWGPDYGRKVDLVAEARSGADEPVTIHVVTSSPFKLEVDAGFATRVFEIDMAGKKTLTLSRP